MDFAPILSVADSERAERTFARLMRQCVVAPVLTGGIAIELHRVRLGLNPEIRPLHDMDFLAASFEEIPKTLATDFLIRHVHPFDPPGRTLLQIVDPETAVRVDFFRAYGGTLSRSIALQLSGASLRMVSIADLAARTARVCLDLAAETPVSAKHARDFLRLLPLVDRDSTQAVWTEHRKPLHPESFDAAATLLVELISIRKHLQIDPEYSRDVSATCHRCEAIEAFPLADARHIRSLLGYC